MAFDPTVMDAIYVSALGGVGYMFKSYLSRTAKAREKRDADIDVKLAVLSTGQAHISRSVERIEITLLGLSGDNGLNSEVKQLRAGQTELWREMDRRHRPAREEDAK